jgi:hypothetical protein
MTPDVAVRLVTEAPRSRLALQIQMANYTGLWIGSSDFWTPEMNGVERLAMTAKQGLDETMRRIGGTI